MTTQVKVITDSASDLSEAALTEAGIGVVPLAIRFGAEEFIDRIEITNDEFWRRMETATELPGTAAPSSEDFTKSFLQAKHNGATEIVCVTISSRLSATFQAASQGARDVADEIKVHLVDSMLCTIAQGLLCLEAARLAGDEMSGFEIAVRLESMKGNVHLYGTLDTLENLKKGGRIGAASAFFGSLLSVKPVITIRDGEVQPMSRQRTRRRALAHLAELVGRHAHPQSVTIAHSNAPDIDTFAEQLSKYASQPLPAYAIGPVIGAHGGPRLVAVAFIDEQDG